MAPTTKRALAESLKKLLSKHSFDKITVKDIVEDCGVNRQTFYYHFHDIYDLIEWIFQDETERIAGTVSNYNDWTRGLEAILSFLLENRTLILNAYHSISHEAVALFVKRWLSPYCRAVVEHQAAELEEQAAPEDLDFVTDVMTLAAAGLINDWISQQMKTGDKTMREVEKLKVAMTGSVRLMLGNLRESEKTGSF